MQSWHDYTNYKKRENADGSYTYIITADGEDVAVNEEIYTEYAAFGRKMRYMELDLKYDRVLQDANGKTVKDENGFPVLLPEREVSLDKLIGEEWEFPSSEATPENEVINRLEIDELYRCLDLLNGNERGLIEALFFDGITEQEYSEKIGVCQKTVNNRKQRILGKLKKILKKP
jgi:RNA polymerase sigma factor (sigma-70 family)